MAIATGDNEISSFIFGNPQEFGSDRLRGMKKDLCSYDYFVAKQIAFNVVDIFLGLCLGTMFADRHNHNFLRSI